MARKIDQMPGRGNGKPKYPWAEWLNGDVWELARGEDFTVPATSMRTMAQMTASRYGVKATVRIRGDKVYVQAHLNGAGDGVPD